MEAPVDPLGNFKRAFQLEVPPDKQPTTEIQASKMKWKFLQAYPQRDPQYRSVFLFVRTSFLRDAENTSCQEYNYMNRKWYNVSHLHVVVLHHY